MARATLLDLSKLNPDQLVQGIIEEAIAASPELNVALARFIPGTEYRTIVHLLAARVESDQAIADAYVDGAGAYQSLEAVGVMEAAYQKVGVQFYYGTDFDGKGFPGLIASCDADNKTVDPVATAAKTSVWFVKFGERDVQFVLGENSVLAMSDWRIESLADDNGKKFPGYVADMTTWIGRQFVNKNSAVRIKNLGTVEGITMTDDLAFEALSKFPAGVKPDYCFMNRRSLEQLRRSRTNVTSPTGVSTLPASAGGIFIVVTDSIVNTET